MPIKKITERWMPRDEVTHSGEEFVYAGDVSNTKEMTKYNRTFNREQGRKTTFVVDKDNRKVVCMYISKTFYPKMCKAQFPSYGKGTLKRMATW